MLSRNVSFHIQQRISFLWMFSFFLCLLVSAVIWSKPSSALDQLNVDRCKREGNALDPTGALADTCIPRRCTTDQQHDAGGALFFAQSEIPFWDGSSSITVPVRGAVFCCATELFTDPAAYDASIGMGIKLSGTYLNRGCNHIPAPNVKGYIFRGMAFGPISGDYLTATVPPSALEQATCDNGNPNKCKLTVGISSRVGNKIGSDGHLIPPLNVVETHNSYFYFYKNNATASATGSLTIAAPSGTTHLSGATYVGTYETSNYSATATKTLTRTDSETRIDTVPASGTAQESSSANGTYSNTSNTISGNLKRSGVTPFTTSSTHAVAFNNIGIGSSKTVCQRLSYGSAFSQQGTSIKTTATSTSTPSCITIYRPTRATFSGSVSTPTSNNDSNIKRIDGNKMLGNGSATSYNLKTSYTLTRTNNSPVIARSKYTTSSSSQSPTAGTLSNWLANANNTTYNGASYSKSQNLTANTTKTINQAVGTYGTHCFYLTYEKEIDYYNGINRLDDRYSLDKINSCTTFYNPRYATFSGTVDVSSTNLTTAGSGKTYDFRGNGYDTSYDLTAYYKINRTDGVSSPLAVSRYSYAVDAPSSKSIDQSKYPTNGTYTTPNLPSSSYTPNTSYTIPVSYAPITVANGQTVYRCFYLSYDKRIGYVLNAGNWERLISAFDTREFDGRAYRCISIFNPGKYQATFSGTIALNNHPFLSGNTGNHKTGNGLRSSFTITPTYTILRTNNSPSSAVTSRYAFASVSGDSNAANYPDLPTAESNALVYNAHQDISGPSQDITLDIDIDDSVTQCFYLRYDNQVTLIGDNDSNATVGNNGNDRKFDGKAMECYTFSNPAQTYTANFTATSEGTLDTHDHLAITDNGHTGTINNASRMSNEFDSNGRFKDDFPSDDKYTATFVHTISRIDEDKSANAENTYYVPSARSEWKIQSCEDVGCMAGVYTDYRSTADDNSSVTVAGHSLLTAKGTSESVQTITARPKWTLSAANKGKYIYSCQRLVYKSQTFYRTATDTTNRNSYKDTITGYSAEDSYSTPVCVTLKNPLWNEGTQAYKNHYIDVAGRTGNITTSGVNQLSSSSYETISLNATFDFDHTVSRYDNYTSIANRTDAGNFDESDAGQSAFQHAYKGTFGWTDINNAFLQKSIYGDPAYDVSTMMWGSERLPNTRANVKYIMPFKDAPGTVNGYPITLNATNKNTGDSWSSDSINGRTRTTFTADNSSQYSLLAGQTKQLTHSTYNTLASWRVQYRSIYRQEVYGGWAASFTHEQLFDRIEKVSAVPRECILPDGIDRVCSSTDLIIQPVNPLERDSDDSAVISVHRPFNYEIDSIEAESTSGHNGFITYAGSSLNASYRIHVTKPDDKYEYITDPDETSDSRYVYVVAYTIPAGTHVDTIQNSGSTSSGKSDSICAHFSPIAKQNSCTILSDSDSAHPAKLSGGTSAGDPDPAQGGPDSAFRHVYPSTSPSGTHGYNLSYSTANIKVPNELAVGEKYCIAIAIRNYTSVFDSSASYVISPSFCKNAAKFPNFQVWGNSVISSGGITTSTTQKNERLFGSWADFSLIANGPIKGMSSGASLISGSDLDLCGRNPLTIANYKCSVNANGNSGNVLGESGIYAPSNTISSFVSYFDSNSHSISDLPGYDHTINAHVIYGDSSSTALNYIIRSDDNITIDRNIILEKNQTYNTPHMPQVIVIAKNINIADNVSRLDAILIATGNDEYGGEINTCTDSAGNSIALSNSTCTLQLTINAPIIARKIQMRRTYGGDPTAANNSIVEAAELINYSPSLILWGYNQSLLEKNPRTTFLNKLPVRF